MRAYTAFHARRAWLAAPLAAALLTLTACSNKPPEDEKGYITTIATARAEKDASFKKDADPIPDNRKAELLPLAYFPIDPEYHVAAGLTPSQDDTIIPMPTSSGASRQMRRAGLLAFDLKGHPLKLTAFVEVGAPDLNHLFVPFSDLTSGTETYPAGRYLDLDRNGTGIYELDFNRAYHPYCYYNASFECPYPPAENRLPLPVRAGERLKTEGRK
jgi:uncharacterized protein (DUF1684 family)